MGKQNSVVIMIFVSVSIFGQIPKDKQLHFGAGAVIAIPSRMIAYAETEEHSKAFLWSMVSVTSVAFAKEIKDEIDYNGFDAKDLGTSILGGLIINLSIEIFKNKKMKRPKEYYLTSSPKSNTEIISDLDNEYDTVSKGTIKELK